MAEAESLQLQRMTGSRADRRRTPWETWSLGGLLAGTALLACFGGCAAYHVARVEDLSLDMRRVADVRALAKYPHDRRATEALLRATRDDLAAVRYFAVEALEKHKLRGEDGLKAEIEAAWIERLSDDARGAYTVFFPGLPVGASAHTPSIRARALLALTQFSGRDLGFDQAAWTAWVQRDRYQRGEPPSQPQP